MMLMLPFTLLYCSLTISPQLSLCKRIKIWGMGRPACSRCGVTLEWGFVNYRELSLDLLPGPDLCATVLPVLPVLLTGKIPFSSAQRFGKHRIIV